MSRVLMNEESMMNSVSGELVRKRMSRARVVLLGAIMLASAVSQAQIAQTPLFVGAKAAPNVVYTMDESWSMAWRYMPDETKQGSTAIYGNPWATGAGDGGDSNNYRWGLSFHPDDPSTCATATCSGSSGSINAFVARANIVGCTTAATTGCPATDLLSARLRSSAFNSIYYNPEVRYRPWYNSDGTPFPDADPAAAWLNPNNRSLSGAAAVTAKTAVNLVGEFTFSASTRWCKSQSSTTANSTTVSNTATENGADATARGNFCQNISGETLAPAVYYTYNGSGLLSASNFRRVRIMDATTFTRGAARDDCTVTAGVATCTQAQEYQNFANWFTYNRSRMFLAIASTSRAFSGQGNGLRVGYARIHQPSATIDGVNSPGTVEKGVRTFEGADRIAFFTWLHALGGSLQAGQLYGAPSTNHRFEGGTPLRQSMDDVGQYYLRSDNSGPWAATPGTSSATAHLPCRKCYNILMTDGMWTGDATTNAARHADRRANIDNTAGTTINPPTGSAITPYTYAPAAPYSDSASNTLADIAMYYWNRDLRTDLANRVAPDLDNPAYWQNMVNFTVGLGVNGTLAFPGDWAALQAGTKSWPSTVSANTPSAVDDLWHAAVNSRGEYFSATNPQEFSEGLSQILNSVALRSESSSATIAANSTRLDTGTLIYQASFDSSDWSGKLRALNLNTNGSVNAEVWNTADPGRISAPASRNIFTATGTQGTTSTTGVDFTVANWGSLSATQQSQLNNGAAATDTLGGQARLNWLRGDSSLENANNTQFRVRTRVVNSVSRRNVLGDIINSDPFFVGNKEDFGYRSLPGTEGSSYPTFLSAAVADNGKSGRRSMIYVGANDGMLHGFDAGAGNEIFGYVPLGVFANLYKLTSPSYQHAYFVDGSPRAGDAYIGGAWRTVVVGSTGAGGKSIFALDVTNPDSMGPAKLLWEFSTTTVATHQLGTAMSQPIIARVRAGNRWVAIFGNGYGVTSGNIKLLVVDLANGSLVQAIDTGVSAVNNGLASVVPVDVNNDRITDYVYGGDLQGHLWRFNLTASTATSDWSASVLFNAVDGSGVAQPITSRPAVGRHPDGGLMLYFGTGKYFEVGDGAVVASPQVQSLYGVRDNGGLLVARTDLVAQQIVFEGNGTLNTTPPTTTATRVRAVSNTGAGSTPASGWYMNLIPPSPAVAQGERAVATPVLRFGRIIFATIIPNQDPCLAGGTSWLMELDAITGGRFDYSVLDANNDGAIDNRDFINVGGTYIPISGSGYDEMIKTPGIVGAGDVEYKYTSGSSGSIGVLREKGGGSALGRQSWRQLQ